MSGFHVDMAATLIPWFFIASGLLSAGYRLLAGRKNETPDNNRIDPDIRVRVTGRIS